MNGKNAFMLLLFILFSVTVSAQVQVPTEPQQGDEPEYQKYTIPTSFFPIAGLILLPVFVVFIHTFMLYRFWKSEKMISKISSLIVLITLIFMSIISVHMGFIYHRIAWELVIVYYFWTFFALVLFGWVLRYFLKKLLLKKKAKNSTDEKPVKKIVEPVSDTVSKAPVENNTEKATANKTTIENNTEKKAAEDTTMKTPTNNTEKVILNKAANKTTLKNTTDQEEVKNVGA